MSGSNYVGAVVLSGLVGAATLLSSAQADEVPRGELLGAMCNTCHGTDGKGSKSIPALAGLDADELFETMKAFQSGEDASTIMDRHAKGYTDEELKQLAEYFARQ